MSDVTLKPPLRLLPLGGSAQRRDPDVAGVGTLENAFDHASLAGGVSPLEHHRHALAGRSHRLLELHQLFLKPPQFLLIELALQLRPVRRFLWLDLAGVG